MASLFDEVASLSLVTRFSAAATEPLLAHLRRPETGAAPPSWAAGVTSAVLSATKDDEAARAACVFSAATEPRLAHF